MNALRMILSVVALSIPMLGHAQTTPDWRSWTITKTSWSSADEQLYSEWINTLGSSGCNTIDSCLKSPKNFLASNAERANVTWTADCGRWPVLLRAYFSWKNHLPFGFVNDVAAVGDSTDLRYSSGGNLPISRGSIVAPADGSLMDGPSKVKLAVNSMNTAMFRFNPGTDIDAKGLFPDFYSVAINRTNIHPGTMMYDPNGHVIVIYKIEDDGRVLYFDGHPDGTVSHGVYGKDFVRSSPGMGAGFKNWRPLILTGATEKADGSYIGGKITTLPNAKIPGYSTEQYYGTNPVAGHWSQGTFVLNGQTLDYYDFVRTRLAVGDLKYHPVDEMRNGIDALCGKLQDRVIAVNGAIKNGIMDKAQPSNLPMNIYGTDGDWEEYSSPSRDARLKTSYLELRTNVERFIQMYKEHNPRLDYSGSDLIADLRSAYAEQTSKCSVTYTKTDGSKKTLSYDEAASRLFAMDFDPYHCIELRWGASSTEELATCHDDQTKQAWYKAEQNLRNQLERTYSIKMGFDLNALMRGVPGTGVTQAPDVDLKAFLNRN